MKSYIYGLKKSLMQLGEEADQERIQFHIICDAPYFQSRGANAQTDPSFFAAASITDIICHLANGNAPLLPRAVLLLISKPSILFECIVCLFHTKHTMATLKLHCRWARIQPQQR
jgi:hypothetical protein